jgi:hypothetical protein
MRKFINTTTGIIKTEEELKKEFAEEVEIEITESEDPILFKKELEAHIQTMIMLDIITEVTRRFLAADDEVYSLEELKEEQFESEYNEYKHLGFEKWIIEATKQEFIIEITDMIALQNEILKEFKKRGYKPLDDNEDAMTVYLKQSLEADSSYTIQQYVIDTIDNFPDDIELIAEVVEPIELDETDIQAERYEVEEEEIDYDEIIKQYSDEDLLNEIQRRINN